MEVNIKISFLLSLYIQHNSSQNPIRNFCKNKLIIKFTWDGTTRIAKHFLWKNKVGRLVPDFKNYIRLIKVMWCWWKTHGSRQQNTEPRNRFIFMWSIFNKGAKVIYWKRTVLLTDGAGIPSVCKNMNYHTRKSTENGS